VVPVALVSVFPAVPDGLAVVEASVLPEALPVEFVSVLLLVEELVGEVGVRSSSPFCGLVELCANPAAATIKAAPKSVVFRIFFIFFNLRPYPWNRNWPRIQDEHFPCQRTDEPLSLQYFPWTSGSEEEGSSDDRGETMAAAILLRGLFGGERCANTKDVVAESGSCSGAERNSAVKRAPKRRRPAGPASIARADTPAA
jgi:hypothetical protein